ncbi:MAG: Rieske (2Fe-2S) protein [Calditrichaeota bacterium]|nr:Rieske (2Fe-2S) protein [Calditrichota bacterium]
MKYDLGPASDFKEAKINSYELGSHDVCVVKVNGEFKAFRNMCPHQYVPLEDGIIKDNWIVCSMHGWLFDMTTGACGVNPTVNLPIYKVGIENGNVVVELE